MRSQIDSAVRVLARSSPARALLGRIGSRYGLRCVLYHDVALDPSPFTQGLNISVTPSVFESQLEVLAREYEFVSLQGALDTDPARASDRPRLLVTFDDAYSSIARVAADTCHGAGIPSVFFVNGSLVDNATLALDNLVAWIVNTEGMAPVEAAARRSFSSLSDFFSSFLPSLEPGARSRLRASLACHIGQDPAALARKSDLYVTSGELQSLPARGMEIGNHTWSHVHCRTLEGGDAEREIGHNKLFLEQVTGRSITAFSYPYGSYLDATPTITSELARTGHTAAFLVEGQINARDQDHMRLCRVSSGSLIGPDLSSDLELFPMLRRVRNKLAGRRI